MISKLIQDPNIDIAGADMFGLTALHKFACWGKVELLNLIIPLLSVDELNAVSKNEGFTALHWCVEMSAINTFELLLKDGRINPNATDKKGKTVRQLAADSGLTQMVELFDKYAKP